MVDFPGGRVGMDIYYRALDRLRMTPVLTSDEPADVLNYLTSMADEFIAVGSAHHHLVPGDDHERVLRARLRRGGGPARRAADLRRRRDRPGRARADHPLRAGVRGVGMRRQ